MRPNVTHRIPTTVLGDLSALFLTARMLGDNRQLDYRALVHVLCQRIEGLTPSRGVGATDASSWVWWTSASSDNAGQNRFLEFAEKELLWTVRRFSPSDSFMVDPSASLGISNDSRITGRLTRFDAPIAFAMGRLAESDRLVVVSDSYPLADPLQRAFRLRGNSRYRNVIAFFGRAIDARWLRTLRPGESSGVDFIDLDEHEDVLFGREPSRFAQREDDLPF